MPPRIVARQLSHPQGFLGRIIRLLMNRTNAQLNAFAIRQLQLKATDRVLEIGFGGGATLPKLLAGAAFVAGRRPIQRRGRIRAVAFFRSGRPNRLPARQRRGDSVRRRIVRQSVHGEHRVLLDVAGRRLFRDSPRAVAGRPGGRRISSEGIDGSPGFSCRHLHVALTRRPARVARRAPDSRMPGSSGRIRRRPGTSSSRRELPAEQTEQHMTPDAGDLAIDFYAPRFDRRGAQPRLARCERAVRAGLLSRALVTVLSPSVGGVSDATKRRSAPRVLRSSRYRSMRRSVPKACGANSACRSRSSATPRARWCARGICTTRARWAASRFRRCS